ncbi:conserved hypothetical protein [Frankia canadensis]|uniref:Uncharacterized protein n=1 Tax=Frankia canadensis TaxID=1836972 RepID=A0A2I2KSL8_9ACTN|nr:conserved hypothetical protein [Frankia canadensis]SOU55916.1 conserved hypothetical protein [Frankia canadensis]
MGLHPGPSAPRRLGGRLPRPGRVGGGRHRLPEGRAGVARGGPDVLRHPGEGRELSDRGVRPCGHRLGVGRGGLAAVPPAVVGRHCPARPSGQRRRAGPAGPRRDPGRGAAPGEMAPRAGHDRRAGRVGTAEPAGGGGRRLRRRRRLPPGPDRPEHPLRAGGEADRDRLPRRRGAGHRGLCGQRPATRVDLPRPAPRSEDPGDSSRTVRRPVRDLAARHPQNPGQPHRGNAFPLPRAPGPPRGPEPHPQPRPRPARLLATRRMAPWPTRTHRLLAVHPARGHPTATPRPPREDPLADRTRLPRVERRPRPRPLRRTHLHRLAPPRHPRQHRPSRLHPAPPRPKSPCAGLTLYGVLRTLQTLLAVWTGACPTCQQPFTHTPNVTQHLSGVT